MSFITAHSFLSLSWDEWGSIALILTTCFGILRRLIKKGVQEVLDPINRSIERLVEATDANTIQQKRANERLERGDKKFIKLEETTKDHERRITRLEDEQHERK